MPWAERRSRIDVAGPALLLVLVAAIISLMLALAVTASADAGPGRDSVAAVMQSDLGAPAPGHHGLGHGAAHACHAAGCTTAALGTTAVAIVGSPARQTFPRELRIIVGARPVDPGLRPPIA